MAEDMRNTFDTFKQDLNRSLPRKARALVQQINGEVQGKRVEGTIVTPNLSTVTRQGSQETLVNVSQPNHGGSMNLSQPFYQTMAYGLNMPPMGSGIPHRHVPNVLFHRTPALANPQIAMMEGAREQIARTLREFGFTPKGCAIVYQKPYPEYFDVVPCPQGFIVPDFTRFIGEDVRTIYEHVG
jgi:hypothetical protein